MEDLQQKLDTVLNDPAMMEKVMAMAQSLGQQSSGAPGPEAMNFDPGTLQKMLSMVRSSGIDGNQRALLRALSPYLSGQRISKLEKAMQAAKLAGLASSALGQLQGSR